ncbi:PKD domain-containing protein [Chitinophagaceae bacterium MMS25-I14]
MNRFYRIAFAIILLFSGRLIAQPLPCPPTTTSLVNAGPDTTICPGGCAKIAPFIYTTLKSTSSYSPSTISYAPFDYSFGTPVIVNQDDVWSQAVGIPFQFCFFGVKYNQLVIGSNGEISFNIGNAGNFNDYNVSSAIPANYTSYNNCIMAPFFDMDPRSIGIIRYATFGTAPCRTFVISFDSVATFPCSGTPGTGTGCSYIATQQIVLYESTYAIDINVKHHDYSTSSTSTGHGVLGIQNDAATLAYSFPGRNNAQWNDTNKSYRFTPNGLPLKFVTWTNVNTGQVVGTNDTLVACPLDTTRYALRVLFTSQCDSVFLYDTVRVNVASPVTAGFDYNIHYGCSEDTVVFQNTSTGSGTYRWDFGDNGTDSAKSPVHIYAQQGLYNVRMIVTADNGVCKDTITKQVDTRHPLDASFTVDHDSACAAQTVSFTNTSVVTVINGIQPTFEWDFGDGTTATGGQVQHSFNPGIYNVRMVVKDFVPCTDTAYHTIVVDSLPYIDFTTSDTALCLGQRITFNGSYLAMGNTGYSWSFGDGLTKDNINPVVHAFDSARVYTVTLSATYRICRDTSISKNITIKPFPLIDLGPDTSICPNGAPLTLHDIHGNSFGASWMWNTGETTQTIQISQPGSYWATVTSDGCSTSDSITVLRDCYLNIPNSFTPNGDGINDYFFPRQFLSRSVAGFRMTIFDRWGQTIFETANIDGRGWDGRFNDKPQPQGAYVYLIDVVFVNGVKEHYQGNVTLLR